MIYFICPNKSCKKINRARGTPSNDWLCGDCETRLKYHRLFMYVYRGAKMVEAKYAPDGQQVSQSDIEFYEKNQQEQDPQPTPQLTSNSNVTNNSNVNTQLRMPELLELVIQPQQKIVITESVSQEKLYSPLQNKGYLFLRRDGNFGKYKQGSSFVDAEETVPEPCVTKGGFQSHPYHSKMYVGRGEVNRIFESGSVTYPDYVVKKDNVVYFIELKTPRNWTFKKYLSEHFYDEEVFGGRSVVDEMNARQALTPGNVENIFLFDIRNNTDENQAITDLGNSIKSRNERKAWWMKNIKGIMLYSDSGLSKKFTLNEILDGQALTNKVEQKNIKSFFIKKK